MDWIKEWLPVISYVVVALVYTAIFVSWITKQNTRLESRVENLEDDHKEHKAHVKSNADEMWRKFESVQNKLEHMNQGIQDHFMKIQNSLGKIEGEISANRKRTR